MACLAAVGAAVPAGAILLSTAAPITAFARIMVRGPAKPRMGTTATITRDFARLTALCTIRWMTHECPAFAPGCQCGFIESPLVWIGRTSPLVRDDTAINEASPARFGFSTLTTES